MASCENKELAAESSFNSRRIERAEIERQDQAANKEKDLHYRTNQAIFEMEEERTQLRARVKGAGKESFPPFHAAVRLQVYSMECYLDCRATGLLAGVLPEPATGRLNGVGPVLEMPSLSMETDLRRAPSVVDKPCDRRSVGFTESQQNQAERSMTDGSSWGRQAMGLLVGVLPESATGRLDGGSPGLKTPSPSGETDLRRAPSVVDKPFSTTRKDP
jgi:hypothetical protein